MFSKEVVFDMPPIDFEGANEMTRTYLKMNNDFSLEKSDILNLHKTTSSLSKNPNKTLFKVPEIPEEPYQGWKQLSSVIFSKNYHKMNFLKNWRQIYLRTHKNGKFINPNLNIDNFPMLFKMKHKLTIKEQARVYFNNRIGATFAEIIKEYRKKKESGGKILMMCLILLTSDGFNVLFLF